MTVLNSLIVTQLIDTLPGMVFRCQPTPRWPMLYLSCGCEAMLGYTREELLASDDTSLRYGDIIHPNDLPGVTEAVKEAIANRQAYVTEYRITTKGGEEKWLWEKGYGIYDCHGNAIAIEGFITDITDRKATELALRQSEERFRATFDSAAVGVCLLHPDGSIFDGNPALCNLLQCTPAELQQHRLTDGTAPQDTEREQTLHQQLLDGTRSHYQLEKRYVRSNGETIWVRLAYSAVHHPDGSLKFLVAIVEDITARKDVEETLLGQQAFLRTLLDNIPQHIYWKDLNLVYQGGNQAWATYAGLSSPAEAIGKTDYDLWPTSLAESYRETDRDVIKHEKPRLKVLRQDISPTGEMTWKNSNKLPIRNPDGDLIGILGTYEDITEIRIAEEAIAHRERYLSTLVEIHSELLQTEIQDQTIHDSRILELLGKVSQADRVYLVHPLPNAQGTGDHSPSPTPNQAIAIWCADGASSLPSANAQSLLPPDWTLQLQQQGILHLCDAQPSEAGRSLLDSRGVRSLLALPLCVRNGRMTGYIGFERYQTESGWSKLEVDLLTMAASAIALTNERKRISIALRDSEKRYRLLAQRATDLIARHSLDGVYQYVSPACTSLLGYTPAEMLGRSVQTFVHPDDLDSLHQSLSTVQCAPESESVLVSYRMRCQSGQYIWFESSISMICHPEAGYPVELITVSRDISERRLAVNGLAGQTRVLEMIATDSPLHDTLTQLAHIIEEQSPGGSCSILLLKGEQLFLGAAPSMPELYKRGVEGLQIGMEVGSCGTAAYTGDLIITEDVQTDPRWDAWRALADQCNIQSCWSMPIKSPQGQVLGVLALMHSYPCTPDERDRHLLGTASHLAGIAIERKRVDEALKRAEEKYRSIFENAVGGIFQTTPDGRYLAVNPMLARIYGYDSPDDLMNSLTDIRHQLYVDPNRRSEFIRHTQTFGNVRDFESQIKRKDGQVIWISEAARAIYDSQGVLIGYEGTVEDITHRKQAEKNLLHRDRLLQAVADGTYRLLMNPDLEEVIPEVLAILGQAAAVDRVYIYENHPHNPSGELALSIRFEWTQAGIAPSIQQPHWRNQPYREFEFMRWYDAFAAGQAVGGPTHTFPEVQQELLHRDHIQSILMVPIFLDGLLWGFIGFDDCRTERVWSASDESILVAIAASFGGAIKRQRTEEQMRYQAFHDALTGLPNRSLFDQQLPSAIAYAERHQEMLAVAFLDLDRFKTINDSLGHAIGDELLKKVTQRLLTCLRKEDIIARWGGDEFTLILPHLKTPEAAARIARRISAALRPSFQLAGHELHVTSSIGIALYPQDGRDLKTLLQNADAALYRVKEQGRDDYQFYTSTINSHAAQMLTLESSLHHALERNEFIVHYQPQIDVHTGAVVQMEALLRWQHPEFGLVPPSQFIAIAEETGLIVSIGEWVLRTACEQGKRWHGMGIPVRMAVNLSARQFQQQNLVMRVATILRQTKLAPQWLELEITETTTMRDMEFTRDVLHALDAMGVRISIDDFGTGYSSLNYLKMFPLHALKVDRSFVKELAQNPADVAIAKTIITLGHGLELQVVAEGVETEEQVKILRSLDCDAIQGYYFSRPLSVDDATQFLLNAATLAETNFEG